MEQMLISNAVDQAINRTDFAGLQGRKVFLEEKYLDCVDKPYLLGSLRHRIMQSGGFLVDAAADAEIVLEARAGAIGTDNTDRFVGIPGMALPGPIPIEIPELRVWEKRSQYGTAKIAVAAYDAATREPLGLGGTQLARSDDSHWSVMGVSPGATGTVHEELSQIPESNLFQDAVIATRNQTRRVAQSPSTGRKHR